MSKITLFPLSSYNETGGNLLFFGENNDKKRRTVLRRSESRRGKRAGRRPPRAGSTERRRQQVQPYRDRCGGDQQDKQGKAPDSYRTGGERVRLAERFGRTAGTDTHSRQMPSQRQDRGDTFGRYEQGQPRSYDKSGVLRVRWMAICGAFCAAFLIIPDQNNTNQV